MNIPSSFDEAEYVKWHEARFGDNSDLLTKLDTQLGGLRASAGDDLEALANLLLHVVVVARKVHKTLHKSEPPFSTPLGAAVTGDDEAYQGLFKTRESVLDKMWRKNREGVETHLDNIHEVITDLVRTEIVAPTLANARFLVQFLGDMRDHIQVDDLKKSFDDRIASADFEPEMKMAAGYFAYHGLIRFKSGLVIEVQVYSALAKEWRRISHKLYERTRLGHKPEHEFGASASRLVSLGHLLHIAECEIERLDGEST